MFLLLDRPMTTNGPASRTYTITELAEEFGVTPRTIRFYEDKGLIRPDRNGMNRVYSRRDRGRLMLIMRGKRLGFSLSEIKEMLDLYDLGDGQVEQLKLLIRKSRERVAALKNQRRDIDEAIAELDEARRIAEQALRERGVAADGL